MWSVAVRCLALSSKVPPVVLDAEPVIKIDVYEETIYENASRLNGQARNGPETAVVTDVPNGAEVVFDVVEPVLDVKQTALDEKELEPVQDPAPNAMTDPEPVSTDTAPQLFACLALRLSFQAFDAVHVCSRDLRWANSD